MKMINLLLNMPLIIQIQASTIYININSKNYINFDDIKHANTIFNYNLKDNDIQGIFELVGNSNGKIDFNQINDILYSNKYK